MVHDQGEIVDSIEANVEKTEVMVEEGASQLRQASNYSVSLLLYIKLLLLCMCVTMYICMHTYTLTYIHIHRCIYVFPPHTYMHARVCIITCTFTVILFALKENFCHALCGL